MHPQTLAIDITENIKEIGKNGCLAFCYIYCAGIDEKNEAEYVRLVSRAIKDGYLGKDCTVKDASKFLYHLTGRKATVIKKPVSSLSDITDATPVRFVAEGYGGHWVVVKDGRIVFNPLVNSVNVNKGKPTEQRQIKWGL